MSPLELFVYGTLAVLAWCLLDWVLHHDWTPHDVRTTAPVGPDNHSSARGLGPYRDGGAGYLSGAAIDRARRSRSMQLAPDTEWDGPARGSVPVRRDGPEGSVRHEVTEADLLTNCGVCGCRTFMHGWCSWCER